MTKEIFFKKAAKAKEALLSDLKQFEEALMDAIPLSQARLETRNYLLVEVNLDDIHGEWSLKEKQNLIRCVDEDGFILQDRKGDHLVTLRFKVVQEFNPNDRIGDGII